MSMAIKYNMAKRAKKMAMGGTAAVDAAGGSGGSGGDEKKDMVSRAMAKRMAKGGVIGNGTPPVADGESADYDVLDGDDTTEADYTGENSGDELGEDRVSRAMKRRKGTA